MKAIKPWFEIWERDEARGGLTVIERAGRLCYKSESRPEGAEKFVRGLMTSGHNSVLEHGDYIFEVEPGVYEELKSTLSCLEDAGEPVPMLQKTRIGGRCIVSGNIRAWRELFAIGAPVSIAFIGHFDPVYVQGWGFSHEKFIGKSAQYVRQIYYRDLMEPNEQLVHIRQTVHFICDRAIQNEFVRHRLHSFSVESSRFCDYNSGKFGGEITVIAPSFFDRDSSAYAHWYDSCSWSEMGYQKLRMVDASPQEARGALPLSLKTEMAMTGSLRAWNHFFDLRALQSTGAAHPQAVELAVPLMAEMRRRFPDTIGCD